jgi:hypothetical protein
VERIERDREYYILYLNYFRGLKLKMYKFNEIFENSLINSQFENMGITHHNKDSHLISNKRNREEH